MIVVDFTSSAGPNPIHLRLSWAISIPTRKKRLMAQESVFMTDELSYQTSSANAMLLWVQQKSSWWHLTDELLTFVTIGSIITLKRYQRSWKKKMAIASIKRHLFKQRSCNELSTFLTNCNQSHSTVNIVFELFAENMLVWFKSRIRVRVVLVRSGNQLKVWLYHLHFRGVSRKCVAFAQLLISLISGFTVNWKCSGAIHLKLATH